MFKLNKCSSTKRIVKNRQVLGILPSSLLLSNFFCFLWYWACDVIRWHDNDMTFHKNWIIKKILNISSLRILFTNFFFLFVFATNRLEFPTQTEIQSIYLVFIKWTFASHTHKRVHLKKDRTMEKNASCFNLRLKIRQSFSNSLKDLTILFLVCLFLH